MLGIEYIRRMDKRLRATLLATVLLLVPQIGQFVTIRALNVAHRGSSIGLLLEMVGVFLIPTSFIVTSAVVWSYRGQLRKHQPILLLAALNFLLIVSMVGYLVSPCIWSEVVAIQLHGCVR